jgi:histone acetyltransferase (RNA polymerase elongator complex component)
MNPLPNPPKPFIVPVFLPHAGCPHRCIFCNQTSTTGCHETSPDTVTIKAAIDTFLAYAKPRPGFVEIAFYGGNFLGLDAAIIDRLLSLAASYVQGGRVHGIRFSTRPDTVDKERLSQISSYPISTVELGVQSMDDAVLRETRRGHTVQNTRQAIELLKKAPYQLGLQMMVGLPGDSEDGALCTGRQLAELGPDFVRIYPTLVLEGSPLARWYAEKRYTPLSLEPCVQLVKKLYRIFFDNGIRVIRMGLQPTTELNDKAAVKAGPFHPAFGELVYSALILDRLIEALSDHPLKTVRLVLRVHPRNLSRVIGYKRANLVVLRQRFGIENIKVSTDPKVTASTILINDRVCRLSL